MASFPLFCPSPPFLNCKIHKTKKLFFGFFSQLVHFYLVFIAIATHIKKKKKHESKDSEIYPGTSKVNADRVCSHHSSTRPPQMWTSVHLPLNMDISGG